MGKCMVWVNHKKLRLKIAVNLSESGTLVQSISARCHLNTRSSFMPEAVKKEGGDKVSPPGEK
jgi:hypothetical protein